MCYTGRCQWENYMGDCTKYTWFGSLPCPTDFDIVNHPNGGVEVIEFEICGGPYDPVKFDNEHQAEDYIASQRFAYDFIVKLAKERL